MDIEAIKRSAAQDASPPPGLTEEWRALWLAKAGRWDEAHAIAQDIPSREGSWIHALLHLIEGDIGNAGYWYARAGRPAAGRGEIDAEWDRIAAHLASSQ